MRLVVLCGSLVALVAAQSETAAGPDQACLAACATTLAGFGACNLTTAATATPAQIACICAPSLLLVTKTCADCRYAYGPATADAYNTSIASYNRVVNDCAGYNSANASQYDTTTAPAGFTPLPYSPTKVAGADRAQLGLLAGLLVLGAAALIIV